MNEKELTSRIGDLHLQAIRLRDLSACMDVVFQGGGGNRAHTAALIEAVTEKAAKLQADLEVIYEARPSEVSA